MAKLSPGDVIEGAVTSFDQDRGFGFARISGAERDTFFHGNDVKNLPTPLGVGSKLTGRVAQGPKGLKLVDVKITSIETADPYRLYAALAVLVSVALTGALVASSNVSFLVAYALGINGGTLFMMGLDKLLSRSGSLRTPEAVVYTMGLLGGSPGIVLGIHVFKHKTRKAGFQFVLLLIFTAQIAVLRLLGVTLRSEL